MATEEEIRKVVHDVLGAHGDETILDYVVGVLEDEHYDHGDEGSETYEHLGAMLVRAPTCSRPAAAASVCLQWALTHLLQPACNRWTPAAVQMMQLPGKPAASWLPG